MLEPTNYIKAASKNRKAVESSNKCGCYYCFSIYSAKEVNDFIRERDGESTAICPNCQIDSVVPDATIAIDEKTLRQVHSNLFGV